MKTILIFILAATTLNSCQSRDKDFISFYRKYKHDSGMLNFTIPAFVINIAVRGQEDEIRELAKSTTSIRVMIKDESPKELYSTVDQYLGPNIYKNLMHIGDGNCYVKIAAKVTDNKIKELVIVVNDSESFVAAQLKGNYTFEQIQDLTHFIE